MQSNEDQAHDDSIAQKTSINPRSLSEISDRHEVVLV